MGVVYAKESSNPVDLNQSSKKKIFTNESTKSSTDAMEDLQTIFSNKSRLPREEENLQTKSIDLHGIKARVDKVHVDGLMRTKDDIVKSQVMDLFKAKDFQDVIIRAYKIHEKLEALGCFRRIGIYIDTSQGPEATPDGVEVTFKVREMRRLVGGVNTMVGNNEGSLMVSAKAPNLCGRGERVQMEYSHGTKSSINFNISAFKPFPRSLYNAALTGTIFNSTNDFPWSGFKQNDKGLLFDVELNPTSAFKHNIQYEAAFRNITCSKQATFRVREQCGPNLKSALRYIWTIDKRNSPIFPVAGSFMRLTTEMAGLGGDIGFFKNEFAIQSNWSPHEYLTFQLGFQCGLLNTISNDLKISIADHFFLGGPLNLRGFDMRGCGPRYDGNSVGGEMYWAAALHIYTPLPFRPGRNSFGDLFRLHGFMNAGNLSNFSFKYGNIYSENLRIFTENVRLAVGGGLAMKLGNVARIELNLIAPLMFMRSDVLQQFQFGIGVQYL
ncbi:PREDICTED: sorting and assembly machinery component 50 homolog [Dinoponera quadriceps]|uniref:Sorting and assembly machinery component 50 homolog n=1 Tax=Dinoponera quadriceps TaxID=609295 RepID=A0A6P3YAZ7_DINQU|nr:PREDICTED: sorting and assembly machinery component 50 homolog [Dinoponera quadriceps]XP_014487528.1 PREDICTED: sorting and assembly machinery component 50 homolog [Dinoponera quadriceps]